MSNDDNLSAPRDWAEPRSCERVVVIAASSGGLAAVTALLRGLPRDLPAAIIVVQHRRRREDEDLLVPLLARSTELEVRAARDGDLLEAGVVYVCPAGLHAVAEHSLRLIDGPRLDHVRPSANALLQSVASTYGRHAIGVVLSGTGADGTNGAAAVVDAGGIVLAQDPATSAQPSMPSAAIARGGAAKILSPEQIGAELCAMLRAAPEAVPEAASKGAPIRVVIADDHRMILDGLRALLETELDIEVIGEAEDGAAAVAMARALTPDVVVMDVSMPGTDGIDATRAIRAELPGTEVVILTAYVDLKRTAQVLEAGAIGFLSKDAAFADLAAAVRSAAAKRPYFSARVAAVTARSVTGAARTSSK